MNTTVKRGEEELLQNQSQAGQQVEVGGIYAHYRDPSQQYQVVGIGTLEATQEPCIFYKPLTGNLKEIVWVRALESWLSQVPHEGKKVPRFQKVA